MCIYIERERFTAIIHAMCTTIAVLYWGNSITSETNNTPEILPALIILIALYKFYQKTSHFIQYNALTVLAGCFEALIFIFGKSFLMYDNCSLITSNIYNLIFLIIVLYGYTILFIHLLSLMVSYIKMPCKGENAPNSRFDWALQKHPFFTASIVILICWIPYIIVFYPGIMNIDSLFQLCMFYGVRSWNTIVPPLTTLLMGYTMNIGKALGSDNLGILLYLIPQLILFILTLSYSFIIMNRLNIPLRLQKISLAFFALFPFFPLFAFNELKDSLYYIVFLWLIYIIIEFYYERLFVKGKLAASSLLTIFTICLFCSIRNDAKYILILLLVGTLFFHKKLHRQWIFIELSFAAGLIMCIFLNNIVCSHYHITNGPLREALSVPLQQTARYMKNYRDEITDEEWEVLSNTLVYDVNVDEAYDPDLSDPVKRQLKYDITKEELVPYFRVWWQQFLKHPGCYFAATFNNIYGYFYIDKPERYGLNAYTSNPSKERVEEWEIDVHIKNTGVSERIRSSFRLFLSTLEKIPILHVLFRPSFYVNLLLLLIWISLYFKKYKELFCFLPAIGILIICCLSPVNGALRYTFPIVCSAPLFAAFCHCQLNSSINQPQTMETAALNNNVTKEK